MDIITASNIDTFSFSGSIDENSISGDWSITYDNGDSIDSSGELSLSNLYEDYGVAVSLEYGETFKGEYIY